MKIYSQRSRRLSGVRIVATELSIRIMAIWENRRIHAKAIWTVGFFLMGIVTLRKGAKMGRLIDADVLISKFGEWYVEEGTEEGFIGTVKQLIDTLSSVDVPDTNAGKWISCKERVPATSDTVLITHRGGVSTGWYNGAYWERGASTSHRMLKTVIAWMPLPEPYKDGE